MKRCVDTPYKSPERLRGDKEILPGHEASGNYTIHIRVNPRHPLVGTLFHSSFFCQFSWRFSLRITRQNAFPNTGQQHDQYGAHRQSPENDDGHVMPKLGGALQGERKQAGQGG